MHDAVRGHPRIDTIAESISPAAFHDLLDRFYTVASASVFRHNGTIDKFVGDELVAIFFPLFCRDRHAVMAIEAARDCWPKPAICRRTAHG